MSLDKELTVFLKYFRKNKEEVIKYHAIKGAAIACELNDKSVKFYSNSIEAINKLIKHWQNYKKKSSASIEEKNAMDSLDGLIMFILQDALPEKEENIIRSSVLKSVELVKNNDMMPAFGASQYIVKSYYRPNGLPHLVLCCENGLIKCDSNFSRYSSEGFCGHTIPVALKNKIVQSFASLVSKFNEKTHNKRGITEDQKQCGWPQSTSSYQKISSWKS